MGAALWEALHADLPEAAVADQLQLYGQFVGAWSPKLIEAAGEGYSKRP